MAHTADITSWIVLFTGLYALVASLGELRQPGSWAAMLDEFEKREGLRFLTGLFLLTLGATVYLVNPWNPADWLSVVVTIMGAAMVLEGLVMLAFGQAYLHFFNRYLGGVNRVWALLGAGIGVVAICLALLRF